MLTIRHYQKDLINKLTDGYKIVLQQQTPETIQMVLAEG
jgi:hypothetical protein